MYIPVEEIVKKADRAVRLAGSRDPYKIARELDVEIMPCAFARQKGAYKVIARNRFIYIKEDLDPVMKRVVLLHELGHDALHRAEAARSGGFREFELFDLTLPRIEREANIFAAQAELDDDEFMELCRRGCSIDRVAREMGTLRELVALKADIMIARGHELRPQEHERDFLGYGR